MLGQQMRKAVPWLARVLAAGGALVIVLLLWPAKSIWPEWKPYSRVPVTPSRLEPGTLVWKQPILPARYAQGSCGACHRGELPEAPNLIHGRQLLARFNCIACHRLQDIDRPAMLGPDLTNVGTKVSREWIYKWLKDPRTVTDADGNVTVDGVSTNPRMPTFHLSDQELLDISAYLVTQKKKPLGPYHFSPGLVAAVAAKGDPVDQGQIRFNQMFCVTCHALAVDRGGETTLIGGDIGPELTKVGSKVKPEWLVAWLRDPQSYLQHTGMPQYQWNDKDMYEVTQYILGRLTDPELMKDVPKLDPPTDGEVSSGRLLFVKKGCAECHSIEGVRPRSDFGPDLSAIGMAGGPFFVEVKSARSLPVAPHFVRSSATPLEVGISQIPRSMIAYLQAKISDPESVTPEARMPRFHMSQADLDDLTTALLGMTGAPIPANGGNSLILERADPEFHPDGKFGKLYQRFKCYQCHAFNGYGGTLAPDLSKEGSRSRRNWLVDFLQNPQTLRPTLTVRMPRFNISEQDATAIADYLSADLRSPNVDPNGVSDSEFTPEMAERGKQLFDQKYMCQSCHTIGSSGGYVGPSLNNAGNWLTPAWIEAWLDNPQVLVSGTIEPRRSFSSDEKRDLTAYLLTLKQTPAEKSPQGAMQDGGHQ